MLITVGVDQRDTEELFQGLLAEYSVVQSMNIVSHDTHHNSEVAYGLSQGDQ